MGHSRNANRYRSSRVGPAIAERRLSLTPAGDIRYQVKTPYRDGTTHVALLALDFRRVWRRCRCRGIWFIT
jgi:hypothetical protein